MDGWKDLLATVAPAVATALGGPLAGVATTALSQKLLGKKDGSLADIANAVLEATPASLLELKQLDLEFEKLQVQREKNILDDVANARARQIAVRDKTPANLTYILIISLIAETLTMLFVKVPDANQTLVHILITAHATVTISACSYWLGSSLGSYMKSKFSEMEKIK